MAKDSNSLEFTPTWVVAIVFFSVALISLCAEHGHHQLGKIRWLNKDWLMFKGLEKLKDVFLLLGFLFLQNAINRICIPSYLASHMLPCKKEDVSPTHTSSKNCSKGKVPLLSQEALQDLQIFVLVLAVAHVINCVITLVLGRARIRQWKRWEDSVRNEFTFEEDPIKYHREHHLHLFLSNRAAGYWRQSTTLSWMVSFFNQFYKLISKSDYIALRQGFIMAHCPGQPRFDFHSYIKRTVESDFKIIVGISWHLWLCVMVFLLLNLEGWHAYLWLALLPLILLLVVGAKLEQIITNLAQNVHHQTGVVHPSDEYFWFGRPGIVLHLIHFILFQNSFEIGFFVWVWCTYGFRSCIMEQLGYIIPRLVIAVIVQILCIYSTLPLHALVTKMGSNPRVEVFEKHVERALLTWADKARSKRKESSASRTHAEDDQRIH